MLSSIAINNFNRSLCRYFTSESRLRSLYGTTEKPAEILTKTFFQDSLQVKIDNSKGTLASVSIGKDHLDVCSGISFLLRNSSWETFSIQLDNSDISSNLRPTLQNGSVYEKTWKGTIFGDEECSDRLLECEMQLRIANSQGGHAGADPDWRIVYEVRADARKSFQTARTGLSVLHPAECQGLPLQIEHSDGAITRGSFPSYIAPEQPYTDIRSISYLISNAGRQRVCSFRFLCDNCFEMEDQRQWGDNSFKTYVNRLSDPHPYTISKGSKIVQAVEISLNTVSCGEGEVDSIDLTHLTRTSPKKLTQSLADRSNPATNSPSQGIMDPFAIAGENEPVETPYMGCGLPANFKSNSHIKAIAKCFANTYSFYLSLNFACSEENPASALKSYQKFLSETLKYNATQRNLHLELILPWKCPSEELMEASRMVKESGLKFIYVSVVPFSHTRASAVKNIWSPHSDTNFREKEESIAAVGDDLRKILKLAVGGVQTRVGAGASNGSFTELNRRRPPSNSGYDFVMHPFCASIHDGSDKSVMKTLHTVPHILATLQDAFPQHEYVLAPSGIQLRGNPYGNGKRIDAACDSASWLRKPMATRDPRNLACFGGAFLLGLAAQAVKGYSSIYLGDTHGNGELCTISKDGEEGQFWPSYHVVSGLSACSAKFECAKSLWGSGKADDYLCGIAFFQKKKSSDSAACAEVWIANTCDRQATVDLMEVVSKNLNCMTTTKFHMWAIDELNYSKSICDMSYLNSERNMQVLHTDKASEALQINITAFGVARIICVGES